MLVVSFATMTWRVPLDDREPSASMRPRQAPGADVPLREVIETTPLRVSCRGGEGEMSPSDSPDPTFGSCPDLAPGIFSAF